MSRSWAERVGAVRSRFQPRMIYGGVLVLLVLLIYLQTARHGFIGFDDPLYVSENENVRRGLSGAGLRWALTTFHAANWHPLTWLSLMADVSLFGLSPGAAHLISAALHAGSGLLLLAALIALTGAVKRCALLALVFAVHPLQVETVAWASERKEVLAGVFFFLVLLAWARFVRRPSPGRYLTALAMHGAGLASKSTGAVLPLILLLLDWWPFGRDRMPPGSDRPHRWSRLLLEKVPFAVLSLVSGGLTLWAQAQSQALDSLANTPLSYRAANAVVAVSTYLGKAIWPARLAFYYPLPMPGWGAAAVIGGSLVLILAVVGGFLARRRHPALTAGLLFFLILLLPVLGLVRVGSQAFADRYLHLPLIGLALGAIYGVGDLSKRRGAMRGAATVAGALAVGFLTWGAWRQVGWWRDSETLYRRALAVTGPNDLVEYDLGVVLAESGRDAEATEHYRRALAIDPGAVDARVNLGNSLFRLGRIEAALAEFRRATVLQPRDGGAWLLRAEAEARLGLWKEADDSLRKARSQGVTAHIPSRVEHPARPAHAGAQQKVRVIDQ